LVNSFATAARIVLHYSQYIEQFDKRLTNMGGTLNFNRDNGSCCASDKQICFAFSSFSTCCVG